MSQNDFPTVAIKPLISYPRQAEVGKSYLMSIDVQAVMENNGWPYHEEEYVIYCILDTGDLFTHKSIGEPAIVLNRFGGSYGPASFILTASPNERIGNLRINLINSSGLLVHKVEIPDIRVREKAMVIRKYQPTQVSSQIMLSKFREYFLWLQRSLRNLSLSAIDSRAFGPPDQQIALDSIYVLPLVVGPDGNQEASIIDAINRHHHLVVLGEPGIGKTSLLNYIALCFSGEVTQDETTNLSTLTQQVSGEDETKTKWEHGLLLPVIITLRDFAARGLPDPTEQATAEHLWAFLRTEPGISDFVPEIRELFFENGGLLLLDGLDEIPEANRTRQMVKQCIMDIARSLPKVRIIVSSRTYAYTQLEWQLPRFFSVTLASFNNEQITEFIDRWYMHFATLGHLKPADAKGRADPLKQALYTSGQLRELAQYPLLLTLMAQVHSRDGFLPEDRADLYERVVKMLLAHWETRLVRDVESDRQVEPELVIQLGVPVTTLRRALSRVAFVAHERQEQESERSERTADIHRLDLQNELKTELGSLDKAELVIHYIQQRAGLLQEHDRNTYTFPHRTFQEYLAAAHIWQQTAEDPVLMLKERVERDPVWWREVFLLAVGIQKEMPTTVGTLISELLFKEPPENGITLAQATTALLAGQAVQDTGLARQLVPGVESRLAAIYERTRNWLLAIMGADHIPARERATAGRILARLGDPRPGVGVRVESTTRLPDIVWGQEILAGTYTIGRNKGIEQSFRERVVKIERAYRMSRYPITYAQFQCFIEAVDYDDPQWWVNMPPNVMSIQEQKFQIGNHPRENVNWYQAVAFCRWLSDKFDEIISLPHEYEWEVAARFPDTRLYPWGNQFDPKKANVNESGIGSTTTVGIYPSGRNESLDLYDLSGNVWEWCRNKYENPSSEQVDDSNDWRAVRGGSWSSHADSASAVYRSRFIPGYNSDVIGFRVLMHRHPPRG